MKILKLYLKNFSRIKSALGVDEVEIDFSKSENLLIFLQGSNGSGKSSILNQLSPWRDPFDGNGPATYGDIAEKIITITNGVDVYEIKHVYSKVSKTFVRKNGEILNTNGNVREAEELINKELGYTPEFLELSRISSSMSGFLDKKSTERKKFITSLMPSIEYYIDKYDLIRSKISDENKRLKSFEMELGKLESVTDEELDLVKSNIDRTREVINKLSNDIAIKGSKIKEFEDELPLIKLSSETEVKAIMDRVQTLTDSLLEFVSKRGKKSIELAKEELELIKENLVNIKVEISSLESTIKSINESIGEKSNSIRSDENMISKLTSIDIDRINNEINRVQNVIKSIDTNETYYKLVDSKEVQFSELSGLNNFIQYTVNNKGLLGKYYEEIVDIGVINLQNRETTSREALGPINLEIKELEKKINEDSLRYNDFMKSQTSGKKHCTDPNCPYEQEILQYEKLGEVIEQNELKLKELNKKLELAKDNYDELALTRSKAEEWLSFRNKYDNSTFKVFSRFYNLNKSDDPLTDYREFNSKIVSAMEEISLLASSNKSLEDLNRQLSDSKDKIDLLNNINNRIATLKKEVTDLNAKLVESNLELSIKKERREDIEKDIKLFLDFIAAKESMKQLLEEKDLMLTNNAKWNTTSEAIKNLRSEASILIQDKKRETDTLDSLVNREKVLERLKINKENVETNIREIRDRLNVYLPINSALDPKKGIPVVFQRVYLKQTAFLANKLLKIAYGEKFSIDFELTDNDFFIRVTDSEGNVREDARSLSDGEKSVVGLSLSLALIEQTGNRDKILYLDEADGVLDSGNRRSFINILESQLTLLGIEQCFIISHNDSFKDVEADVILLRDGDTDPDHLDKKEDFLRNKNVIFDYKDLHNTVE